jgi:hypothetical protein
MPVISNTAQRTVTPTVMLSFESTVHCSYDTVPPVPSRLIRATVGSDESAPVAACYVL